jgi:diadenosine tetraphosphate (Ap4A) HIT family hydrolase
VSATTDFERLVLVREPLWKLQVHECQTYLGRLVLVLNRPAEIDYLDLTDPELLAMRDLARRGRGALDKLFKPDMYNHATLRNEWRQQHWHLVPRYKAPREFAGQRFADKRWGHNWAPYDRQTTPEPILLQIRDALRAELS